MRFSFPAFLILINSFWANAQLSKTAGDCKDAIPIKIESYTQYGPTQLPQSFGEIQEFNADKNSEASFCKEHNSAWYLLTVDFDGEFTFEIIATDSSNDYDFLLYRYTDTFFCNSLLNKTITPIRGNLSNNKWPGSKGVTGLSSNETQLFHKQGLGNPFSKSITVKKGEKYMLVLDNFTPMAVDILSTSMA